MGRPQVGRGRVPGRRGLLGGSSAPSWAAAPSAALTAQPGPPQAAALAVCQYLAVECAHPSSPAFEDGSSSEASTPVPAQHLRPVRARKRRQSPVPALPIVVQLMEMGFPRRNIELALKSLMGASGNAAGLPGAVLPGLPRRPVRWLTWRCWRPRLGRGATLTVCVLAGVEALVGWLLDHADVPGTDLSDPDTGSEDGSDEDLLEDLDDTAYALVSAPAPPPPPCPPVLGSRLRRVSVVCQACKDAEAGRASCGSVSTDPAPTPGMPVAADSAL